MAILCPSLSRNASKWMILKTLIGLMMGKAKEFSRRGDETICPQTKS